MKRIRNEIFGMILMAVCCGMGAFGAEQDNPPMRSRQSTYVPEQKSTWLSRNAFGQVRGTFVGGTRTRVKLKLKRGYEDDVVEIPLFYFGAGPVFQYLSYMAKIPEDITEYYDIKPGRRLLVHVDASDLPLGELKEWKNSGELKGGFFPMNIPPKVEDFNGRRGVRFDPNWGKIAKPDHNTLAANFTVNDYLGHGTPFQDKQGRWWCTAFYNGNIPPVERKGIENRDLSATAQTINQRGVTIVPLDVKVLEDGAIYIRAKDPAYANPGPDEVQQFAK